MLQRRTVFAAFLAFLLLSPLARPAPGDESIQIHWERSLEDAQALAKAADRPLFVAVNMDGESACERIVHEQYRDPAFVQATRAFVCVVANPVRHTLRDYDDQGRRVLCPRLGEVTCGEHVALEPLVYDRFLSDADRVAPRHALVMPDGTKAFDAFLLFDLRDLDVKVLAASRSERERRSPRGEGAAQKAPLDPERVESWREWAGLRRNRERSVVESVLAAVESARAIERALEALSASGNAGSLDALRLVARRARRNDAKLLASTRALGLESGLANALRDAVRGLGAFPGSPEPGGVETCLPLLAELDGKSPATRSLLLGCAVLGDYGAEGERALAIAFDAPERAAIQRAVEALGGPVSIDVQVAAARRVWCPMGGTSAGESLPRAGYSAGVLREAGVLEVELARLEDELKDKPDDAATAASYALAASELGRRRIEANQPGAQFFFEDAEVWFDRALKRVPSRADWWIERARCAYYLLKFEDQARHGREALARSDGRDEALAVEALRWIGDANARMIAERSGKDAGIEAAGLVEGARALGRVAASPYANGTDWTSFASLFGTVGLWREECAVVQEGVLRLPADLLLRQRLNLLLWSGGRVDLAPLKAEWIADRHAGSADAAWFAGYAWLLGAEDARRRCDAEAAIEAYARAREWFARSIESNAAYGDSATHYLAMAWLGSGFAELLRVEQSRAARALVEAVKVRPGVIAGRDGLDREALDLVDGVIEWRAGRPSGVEGEVLAGDLVEVGAGADWLLAVSDAELREALRADGRNPERAMRDTVDAAGKPIRMELGRATKEGDRYLARSLSIALRARTLRDDEPARWAVAQCSTIAGERWLERGDAARAAPELERASVLLAFDSPGPTGSSAEWVALAKRLRDTLGPARPRDRPGR